MFNSDLTTIDLSVQDLKFDQPVVNIGGHADNDIVVTGEGVLAFHAMVVLQDDILQLISLAPEAEILLNGHLLEQVSVDLDENHRIEIGDYALFFQKLSPSDIHVIVSHTGLESTSVPHHFAIAEGEEAILVNILSQQTEVDVEQRAAFEFEVVNAGPIVARFFIALQGVPEEWSEITPEVFNLNEGQRKMISVNITPPRSPASTAGIHDLKFVVTSPNYPSYRVETPCGLQILPFYEFAVGNPSPKQQRISYRKRTGFTHLPITNLGNSTTDFNITAVDDENGCSFDFWVDQDLQLNRQATLTIPSGDVLDLPIQISPLKQAIFALRSKRYHYTTTVHIPQQAASPQIISASAISTPLFGWWTIMLGIIAILLGLFILLQPNIRSFEVAAGKDIIELGDTTKLEWSVSPFATRLSIDNINQPINRGQKTLTIAPTQSTTYQLTSGNWLSGMIGGDHKATQTVLVVPPTPSIGVFEVDSTMVDKGTPVNIRWSVTKADQVFLTIEEVVYELSPSEFSGEQEYMLEKNALVTLEAKNSSGSELRSYFINVVPPEITVNTFTVWVRSEGASSSPSNFSGIAAKSGGGRLYSKIYIPDPNFPDKLVELVPDPAASNGYRVEIYQPDRELQKGEQVMLEWNIGGVDTVHIAPFTEELPNIGVQPFFPQESMNFVMTATSGELEQLFMLPVKVYDGEPPEPPTIEFFQASPSKLVGAGAVEFAWSVSGEWTRVQIATGEDIIADYLNPQGFETATVSESSTFILTAWNGADLSSAMPVDIIVDPALIKVGLEVTDVNPKPQSSFLIGENIIVSVAFSDVPDDSPKPSGKVIITDETAICEVTLPAKTCTLTFTTAGDDKSITASYEGDDIYASTDSEKYIGYVVNVESAQVDIQPKYFNLETDPANNDAPIPGALIPDISNATLSLDSGLYIKIEVRPLNTSLEDDEGSVNLNICEEENDEIKPNSCIFLGSATVIAETNGLGNAEIVVQHFPDAGERILLFEYKHAQGAIDPTSVEHSVSIDKLQMYIFASEICDPFTLDNCIIGLEVGKTPIIHFDLALADNATYIPLPSLYPEPPTDEKFEFGSTAGGNDWTCNVETGTNGEYLLVCEGDFTKDAGHTENMTMGFENNGGAYYYKDTAAGLQSQAFDIFIKHSTSVEIDSLSGFKVGETFFATANPSGANAGEEKIHVTDSDGNNVAVPSPGSSMELSDVFGAVASTGNYDVINGKLTITSIGSDSEVYFDTAGNHSFTAEYLGNAEYSASTSKLTSVTVSQQDEITTDWYWDKDGDGHPFENWATGTQELKAGLQMQARVVLAGPTGFYDKELIGRNLVVQFDEQGHWGGQNCTVVSGTLVDGVDGAYLVEITEDTNTAVADFTFSCLIRDKTIELSLSFSESDSPDFSFDSAASTSRTLKIIKNSINMDITIYRDSDSANASITPPIQFYLDEKFHVDVKLYTYGGWYYYGQNFLTVINKYLGEKVIITLPNKIKGNIDSNNTTCTINNNKLEITLSNYGDVVIPYNWIYWGWVEFSLTGGCDLTFDRTASISPPEPLNFEYTSDDRVYHATGTFNTDGIAKQSLTVDLSPVPLSEIIGVSRTITVDLTPDISGTSLEPLDVANANQRLTADPPAACGTVSSITKINDKQASFTIESDTSCTNETLLVNYNGNTWFSPGSGTATITFNKRASVIGAVTVLDASNANWEFDTHNPVKDADYTVTVPVEDNDVGNTSIPDGVVEVWVEDSSGKISVSGNYSITGGGSPTNDVYTVSLDSSGDADFTIKFLDDTLTGLSLMYEYTGSNTFIDSTGSIGSFDVVP